MIGLLASLASTGYGMYTQLKAQQANLDAMEAKMRVQKAAAAESLAVTYNSILAKSLETSAQFNRKVFELNVQTRQAEGDAVQKAASTGAYGRRVQLSRDMAIRGGSERMMTNLELDLRREQDALIERADMEERSMINRLVTGTPDIPADMTDATLINGIASTVNSFSAYKDRVQTKQAKLEHVDSLLNDYYK